MAKLTLRMAITNNEGDVSEIYRSLESCGPTWSDVAMIFHFAMRSVQADVGGEFDANLFCDQLLDGLECSLVDP